ncbi:MAG: nucleotidyltransferase family protein [Gemmataceae bacterium]
MDAVILAAGLGTRLRPHTLTTPKPLLPVQGRPLMDWTLQALPKVVDRVIVVVHYLADQIETFIATTQQRFQKHALVPQGEPQGTGDALRKCRDFIESDSFLVLNGDDLYSGRDLATLAACRAGVMVHPVMEPEKFGVAILKADGILDRLEEKNKALKGPQLANVGAYKFPKEVFDLELTLSPRGEYEITEYVSKLAQKEPFHVIETDFWLPIGTEEAWNHAQQQDLQGNMKAH